MGDRNRLEVSDMGAPYKGMNDKPAKAPPAATEIVPLVPGTDDPRVNQERSDHVPMWNPPIAWPAAPGTDKKPMKLAK
jgi:hypothetical protein